MKKSVAFVASSILFGGLVLSSCQKQPRELDTSRVQQAWNSINDPMSLYWNFETDFYKLPLEASLSKLPWVDTYWPSNKGGIAQRWNGSRRGFGYRLASYERVKRMSERELKALSPAEKFDIYNGDYTYPTVKREWRRVSPRHYGWEGICHGWAPAALNFDEPKPVTLEGANGIKVPFGSADVKALLSYYQGEVTTPVNRIIGARCNSSARDPRKSGCLDMNAGAFHVSMTNFIGLRQRGFIIDVTNHAEVWNHPVHTYKSRILSEQGPSVGAAPGTVKEISIEATVTYAIEIQAQWQPPSRRSSVTDRTKTYRYKLELNISDEIIGGAWLTADRPDFLWFADKPEFTDSWASLSNIYQASITQ